MNADDKNDLAEGVLEYETPASEEKSDWKVVTLVFGSGVLLLVVCGMALVTWIVTKFLGL